MSVSEAKHEALQLKEEQAEKKQCLQKYVEARDRYQELSNKPSLNTKETREFGALNNKFKSQLKSSEQMLNTQRVNVLISDARARGSATSEAKCAFSVFESEELPIKWLDKDERTATAQKGNFHNCLSTDPICTEHLSQDKWADKPMAIYIEKKSSDSDGQPKKKRKKGKKGKKGKTGGRKTRRRRKKKKTRRKNKRKKKTKRRRKKKKKTRRRR